MTRFISSTALAVALGLSAGAALAQNSPAPTSPAPSSEAPTSAPATAAPAVTQGATVYDAQGGTVGTVEAVDAQLATVSTATTSTKVKIPLGNFGAGDKGPVIGMTAAQLDTAAGVKPGAAATGTASASGTAAPAGTATTTEPPKLAKGASVSDTSGAPVGTIEDVSAEFATVATAKNKVRLPLTAFAAGTDGPVIGMTADQLDAAAEAAKPKG